MLGGADVRILTSFALALFCAGSVLVAQQPQSSPDRAFFEHSLHFTNQGLQHWYAKENGGLERITGVPFSSLNCNGCHVRTCDTCHAAQAGGRQAYSVTTAKAEASCEKCHDVETRDFARKNPHDPAADVHFAAGMKCMDCHSAREVHGDGVAYTSMQAPGAMETRCENCHKDLAKCPSATMHAGRVDCSACHTREVASCYNCHFDTKVKEGKSVSLPLKNLLFLINHDGKVTVANLHTFIYQNKTMIVFAPAFPHSIVRHGRECDDCHGSESVRAVQAGTLKAVKWDNDQVTNTIGVIPVVAGYEWDFPFLNYVEGKWIAAKNPATPLLNYSGWAQPMTRQQLAKLAQRQVRK